VRPCLAGGQADIAHGFGGLNFAVVFNTNSVTDDRFARIMPASTFSMRTQLVLSTRAVIIFLK
jgi:hypothetical protein